MATSKEKESKKAIPADSQAGKAAPAASQTGKADPPASIAIAVNTPFSDIARKLNESVTKVLSSDTLIGFEKAYLIASETKHLKEALTTEYMKPIMELQNSKLGFLTDKDEGYPEAVVKNCLIQAVLTGVQPFGNQFNIIKGQAYITKEGFGYLLSNYKGLHYEIITELPRVNANSTGAAVKANVKWTLNGATSNRTLDIPIRMNSTTGLDAILGKCLRKARAWLYNTLTGSEIGDGDTTEVEGKVLSSTLNSKKDHSDIFPATQTPEVVTPNESPTQVTQPSTTAETKTQS